MESKDTMTDKTETLCMDEKKRIAKMLALSKSPETFIFPLKCSLIDIDEIKFISDRMKNNLRWNRDPEDNGTDHVNSIDDRMNNLHDEKEDPNEW